MPNGGTMTAEGRFKEHIVARLRGATTKSARFDVLRLYVSQWCDTEERLKADMRKFYRMSGIDDEEDNVTLAAWLVCGGAAVFRQAPLITAEKARAAYCKA